MLQSSPVWPSHPDTFDTQQVAYLACQGFLVFPWVLSFYKFETCIWTVFKSRVPQQIPKDVSTVFGSEKPSAEDLHTYLFYDRSVSAREERSRPPGGFTHPRRPGPAQVVTGTNHLSVWIGELDATTLQKT